MTQSNTPMYVILSTENMTQAQVAEINQLTRELGLSLDSQSDAVESVSITEKNDLPQGTKVALEAIIAEQVILRVAPLVTNWALGKIEAGIKLFSERVGKTVKAKVIVGSREVQITPKTTPQELTIAAQQVKAASELAPSNRYALVIGNSSYKDERLPNLQSAALDAERFAGVLSDPNLGAFTQVETLINKTHDVIEHAIEKFFKNKAREDMLLLYFSGHGIKSQSGQLFLAAENTSSELLRSTGIAANFIKENMGESNSQRQVLILDCCYGGAIVEGAKGDNAVGQAVNSILSFQPSGFGKIIITASEAMQYAFDGKHVEGQTQNSLFTRYLIEGLQTGTADSDNDGLVDIDELYQFAYKHVTPQQTPNISSTSQEGRMFIGLNPNPKVRLAPLPDHLQKAMNSDDRYQRQGAVIELSRLLKSPDPSDAMAAEMALRKMVNDDSKLVSDSAQEALDRYFKPQKEITQPQPPIQRPETPKSPPVTVISTQSPPTDVIPAPPINVTTPNIPSTTVSVPPQKLKKPNLGGFLNILIPGGARAYVGNWGRAVLTFIVVTSLVIFILYISSNSYNGSSICIPAILGEMIYMFIAGRNLVIKHNKKLSGG